MIYKTFNSTHANFASVKYLYYNGIDSLFSFVNLSTLKKKKRKRFVERVKEKRKGSPRILLGIPLDTDFKNLKCHLSLPLAYINRKKTRLSKDLSSKSSFQCFVTTHGKV